VSELTGGFGINTDQPPSASIMRKHLAGVDVAVEV
jgi:hypothetical protein